MIRIMRGRFSGALFDERVTAFAHIVGHDDLL